MEPRTTRSMTAAGRVEVPRKRPTSSTTTTTGTSNTSGTTTTTMEITDVADETTILPVPEIIGVMQKYAELERTNERLVTAGTALQAEYEMFKAQNRPTDEGEYEYMAKELSAHLNVALSTRVRPITEERKQMLGKAINDAVAMKTANPAIDFAALLSEMGNVKL